MIFLHSWTRGRSFNIQVACFALTGCGVLPTLTNCFSYRRAQSWSDEIWAISRGGLLHGPSEHWPSLFHGETAPRCFTVRVQNRSHFPLSPSYTWQCLHNKRELGQANKKTSRKETEPTSGSEWAAILIRLVSLRESYSAMLHPVPQIINMHCGDTWQKAISEAISFPKQGRWGVHFKCPATTTLMSLCCVWREKTMWLKKKKTFQTCHQLKMQKMSWMCDSPSSNDSILVNHSSIIPFSRGHGATSGDRREGWSYVSSCCCMFHTADMLTLTCSHDQ